jgi:hypothetical protein
MMEYYFDEFETYEIQAWLKSAQEAIPGAKMRGDIEDVKIWENIVTSTAKELQTRWRDGQ